RTPRRRRRAPPPLWSQRPQYGRARVCRRHCGEADAHHLPTDARRGMSRLTTALVTGASGFIGRRLCAALAHDGARVRALVRDAPAEGPWHERIRIDLATEELPANACDGV